MLLCAEHGDTESEADQMLAKILKLRIFGDDAGKMNRSVQDIAGGLLVVSQFTLAADTSAGNRPGFTDAAPPDDGLRLVRLFSGAGARGRTRWCRTGNSAPRCRWRWSMTDR